MPIVGMTDTMIVINRLQDIGFDEQTATNASLAADIANRNDPDTVLAIAKERMRLVESGEIIFYDTTN